MIKTKPVLFLLICIAVFSCTEKKRYPDALTPEQSIKTFQLNGDFDIEVYAAEPFVKDPVSLTFDDEGNAFVAELPDYPYQPEPGKGHGRIKMLIDINHDGRIDSAIVFADGLSMPTSILPWKGGLIVTAAPNILYLKDTNSDHKADTRDTLFSGFFATNMEAQITALRFNIDNWIYAANYGREGEVTDTKGGKHDTLAMSGADFRFRMDKNLFERETGLAQFGQALDDWGNRFLSENSVHIEEPVIPWRYLYRHSFLLPVKTSLEISDHAELMNQVTPAPYWRAERTKRRNKAFQEQKSNRVEYADKHFTGASGGVVYTGDVYPEKYNGNFFVTEVAGNLVHRDILIASDSTPHHIATLDPLEKDKEFLTTTDPWFRPTSITIGPDGCMYLVDMYRQHIETPFAIPEDLKKDMDFMAGSEMGRIYRIVPKNGKFDKNRNPNFIKMNSDELVTYLSHPNQAFRLTAQRLLLERQDKSVIPSLVKLFSESKDPRYRLHAFYTLDGLNALNLNLVKQAINDADPSVRKAGIQLGERYPECLSQFIERTKDSSIEVAFQATLSLGNYPFKQSGDALADVLLKYGQDQWFTAAVLSSDAGASLDFFELLTKKGWFNNSVKKGQSEFFKELTNILGLINHKDEILKFMKTVSDNDLIKEKDYKIAILKGFTKGYEDSEKKPKTDPAVVAVFESISKSSTDADEKKAADALLKALQ